MSFVERSALGWRGAIRRRLPCRKQRGMLQTTANLHPRRSGMPHVDSCRDGSVFDLRRMQRAQVQVQVRVLACMSCLVVLTLRYRPSSCKISPRGVPVAASISAEMRGKRWGFAAFSLLHRLSEQRKSQRQRKRARQGPANQATQTQAHEECVHLSAHNDERDNARRTCSRDVIGRGALPTATTTIRLAAGCWLTMWSLMLMRCRCRVVQPWRTLTMAFVDCCPNPRGRP